MVLAPKIWLEATHEKKLLQYVSLEVLKSFAAK
jgi:uncharacterized protein (DUF2237 family)